MSLKIEGERYESVPAVARTRKERRDTRARRAWERSRITVCLACPPFSSWRTPCPLSFVHVSQGRSKRPLLFQLKAQAGSPSACKEPPLSDYYYPSFLDSFQKWVWCSCFLLASALGLTVRVIPPPHSHSTLYSLEASSTGNEKCVDVSWKQDPMWYGGQGRQCPADRYLAFHKFVYKLLV